MIKFRCVTKAVTLSLFKTLWDKVDAHGNALSCHTKTVMPHQQVCGNHEEQLMDCWIGLIYLCIPELLLFTFLIPLSQTKQHYSYFSLGLSIVVPVYTEWALPADVHATLKDCFRRRVSNHLINSLRISLEQRSQCLQFILEIVL